MSYSFDELYELGSICVVEGDLLDVSLSLEKYMPFLALILLIINSKPAHCLFLSPMSAFYDFSWQFFDSIFGLIFSSLYTKDWIWEYSLNDFSFLIEEDSFQLLCVFEHRVDDVSLI